MGSIVVDDSEKLEVEVEALRSKVVGKYGSVVARDLLSPRRLLRYHPREAAAIGGGLALAIGVGLAYALRDKRLRAPSPPPSRFGGLVGKILVGVATFAGMELLKRALSYGLVRLQAEERFELPPLPEPDPERMTSLEPPDVSAFAIDPIKKKG